MRKATPPEPWSLPEPFRALFLGPVSVALDRDGHLYVAETNRHRFQVYQKR